MIHVKCLVKVPNYLTAYHMVKGDLKDAHKIVGERINEDSSSDPWDRQQAKQVNDVGFVKCTHCLEDNRGFVLGTCWC